MQMHAAHRFCSTQADDNICCTVSCARCTVCNACCKDLLLCKAHSLHVLHTLTGTAAAISAAALCPLTDRHTHQRACSHVSSCIRKTFGGCPCQSGACERSRPRLRCTHVRAEQEGAQLSLIPYTYSSGHTTRSRQERRQQAAGSGSGRSTAACAPPVVKARPSGEKATVLMGPKCPRTLPNSSA